MSTTSADVAGFAKGHTITHDGVTVEFKYLDDTLLAQYERDRFELERSKLNLLKNDYTREEYVERLDKLYNAYRKNEMALERDTEFRQSREGMMFLLGLMLQVEGKPI